MNFFKIWMAGGLRELTCGRRPPSDWRRLTISDLTSVSWLSAMQDICTALAGLDSSHLSSCTFLLCMNCSNLLVSMRPIEHRHTLPVFRLFLFFFYSLIFFLYTLCSINMFEEKTIQSESEKHFTLGSLWILWIVSISVWLKLIYGH